MAYKFFFFFTQSRQNKTSLVIKQNQGPLVSPQWL